MKVYSIGAYTMPFRSGLCLNIKHSWIPKHCCPFSILYRLYLEAVTEKCSLKYVFFKTRERRHWIKILTHYNDREDQHDHVKDVKLLLITYIQKILSSWYLVSLLLRFTKGASTYYVITFPQIFDLPQLFLIKHHH